MAYISTCSDHRPGPGENSLFLILDLKTGKYRELIDTKHIYGFIVVDYLGHAYHPMLGGGIVRYDPRTDKIEQLKQTIDGKSPTPESHLADADGHPINWDITHDGTTLYCVPMSTNRLYRYDLTQQGDTLNGKSVGALIEGSKHTDCRAMCVGPKGRVCIAITDVVKGIHEHHLVTYTAGDKAPCDHGQVAIRNPDYTPFADSKGKPLPFHGGIYQRPDGITTTKYVILGVCEAKDGAIYVLALHPYTVLQIAPSELK